MPYTKTTWMDEVPSETPVKYTITDVGGGKSTIQVSTTMTTEGTPVNATNLNKIEDGIEAATQTAEAAIPKSLAEAAGDLLYATAVAVWARLAKPSYESVLKMSPAGVPSWKTLAEIVTIIGRQGGSASDWNTYGLTNYSAPTAPKIQVGFGRWIAFTSSQKGNTDITFPSAFSGKPIVFITPSVKPSGVTSFDSVYTENITNTGFTARAIISGGTSGEYLYFSWMAIGE